MRIAAGILLIIVSAWSCAPDARPPFAPEVDKATLSDLKDKKLLIIAFVGDGGFRTDLSKLVGLATVTELVPLHKGKMIEEWSGEYDMDNSYLVAMKKEEDSLFSDEERARMGQAGKELDLQALAELDSLWEARRKESDALMKYDAIARATKKQDLADAREYITSVMLAYEADFGLVHYDRLAWKSNNHCFKSCTMIFDKQIRPAWSFCGQGQVRTPFSFGRVLRQTIFMPDSPQAKVDIYRPFFENYPKLLRRLLEEDLAGQEHKKASKDYFEGQDPGFWVWQTEPKSTQHIGACYGLYTDD